MYSTIKTIMMVMLGAAVLSACQQDDVKPLEPVLALQEAALHPEGIAYSSKTGKIYAGSYFKGKIVTLGLDGTMQDFVNDESLVAVVGMDTDDVNNRLVVCNADAGISMRSGPSTAGQLAEVVIYDLITGSKQKTIELQSLYQGGHFVNDLTIDHNGNIYVTDSFSPVIYKIDAEGNASVLVTDAKFQPPMGAFGLNGIVYHPDGYLIAGTAYNGLLYKVPLDNPEQLSEIAINGSVNSLDGLLLADDNTLMLVSNNFTMAPFNEAVYRLTSADNWSNADISGAFTNLAGTFPTTLARVNNAVYVNHAFFLDMVNPNTAPVESFPLQKVTF
jgi:sugar lactone lactonase YvrE